MEMSAAYFVHFHNISVILLKKYLFCNKNINYEFN